MRRPSTTILWVAAAFQLVVALAALFGFAEGARYVEFALRRSVEHAAAEAVSQWKKNLEYLAEELPRVGSADKAHLLPIPTLDRTELARSAAVGEGGGRPLPGTEDLRVSWERDFAGGLSGVATVRALPACRACHPGFAPGEPVGVLRFHVATGFLTKLLATRRANLAALVGAVFLLTSGFLWGLAVLGYRRQRRTEDAMAATEAALRASEERYRTLVEHSLVGVYLIQGDRVVYCNQRAAEMFGYSVEEVTHGKTVWDLVAPEDRALVAENLRTRFAGEVEAVRYSLTALKKDGTRFPAEVFGARTVLPSGPAVLGMIVDNTASEHARKLIENAYRAVVALPGEDFFQAAATSLATVLDVPVVFVAEKAEGGLLVLGSHGLGAAEVLPLAGTPCEQVILRRSRVEIPSGFTEAYGVPDFVKVVPEAYFGFPLADSQGEVLGVLALLDTRPRAFEAVEHQIMEIYAVRLGRELEQRKLVQQRRELEARLAASEKLAALGVLAGGIAHDFNNVLAGILAEAELLAHRVPDEAKVRVSRIVELAHRGGDVVRRILAFARPEVAKPAPVSVSQWIGETVELARRTLGPQVQLVREVEPNLYVLGDSSELQQLLFNLLTNARDAMPEGGPVMIRAYGGDSEVTIEVADRGVGIDPKDLPRVFEPFFTTKPRGKGTGLGLTTVYRIAEAYGGRVDISSRLGEGTTVRVVLPRAEVPPEGGPELSPGEARAARQATVLLVDDERPILDGLCELLSLEGYRVIPAASGEEAWEVAQDQAPDVAVVDVLLPGMSGVQLATKLVAQNPELAVVFSSGHAPEALPPELAQRRRIAFLQKPYSVQELLGLLGNLLEKP